MGDGERRPARHRDALHDQNQAGARLRRSRQGSRALSERQLMGTRSLQRCHTTNFPGGVAFKSSPEQFDNF
jgi:hypothetical protein